MAGLLYGFSVMVCMNSGMSTADGAGVGYSRIYRKVAEEMTKAAGFDDFSQLDIDSPMNNYYLLRESSARERLYMHASDEIMNDTHSLLIGYLLWIFGFLGAHRFYFGRPVSGTVYLFTFGLLGIGWLVDLFLMPSLERQQTQAMRSGR